MPSKPAHRYLPGTRSSSGRETTVVAATYAALVLSMWIPFTLYSGMPYETAFPYMSETRSVLGGFLYIADPLRIHTNTFYHVSYLLAEVLGVGGSYVPYQIVHALLWWGRGFLVFLLIRRLFPDGPLVSYAAGAVVVVHASDGAIQWIGQMNQFGFIFWMLLAWYLFVIGLDATRFTASVLAIVAACCVEYMSLWSYEAQLVLLLVFPPLLLIPRPQARWKLVGQSLAWYSVAAVYLWLTAAKYMSDAGHTYQETVIRRGWAVGDLLGDLGFNIAASLEFWTWRGGQSRAPAGQAIVLSLFAGTVFVVGVLWVARHAAQGGNPLFLPKSQAVSWRVLGMGAVL